MTERVSGQVQTDGGRHRAPGIVVALLGMVFLALIATQWRERQLVLNVDVQGASGLSLSSVQHVTHGLVGSRIRTVALADVRRTLEQLPYVQKASVYLSGVRNITVDISEREPAGHVVLQDGSLRYIDVSGTILPEAPVRTSHNVPILQTTDGGQLSGTELRHIAKVLSAGKRALDPVLFQSISEIRYDRGTHNVVVVTDRNTWRMQSASVGDAERSFADMNVFWSNESARQQLAEGCDVDLRWNHQIIIRRMGNRA